MDNTVSTSRPRAATEYAIRFWNRSGETIPPHGVVSLRENGTNGISRGRKPIAGSSLHLVNGPREVAANKYGELFLWNTPRRVKIIGAPDVGSLVGPIPGSWGVGRGGGGFRVLFQPAAANTTAVVIFTGEATPRFLAKLDGNLPAAANPATTPGTAVASVWRRTPGGIFEDSGDNVNVVNRMRNISVISGAWVEVHEVDGEFRLYVADCG